MGRRRIYWHIGPDDLGTAFLAEALDVRREELAQAGILVPGTTTAWELSTVELRRSHQQLGYARREVEGQSAALVRRIWQHRGTTVLSTPGLAAATPDQIALALDALRGVEIHLVLVVRDLTSQAYAAAQGVLEEGATSRPEKYVPRVLEPGQDHPQTRAFQAGHELPEMLRRWTRTVLPEHVHVLAESDPGRMWQRLMTLLGAEVPAPAPLAAPQLGPEQLAILRATALAVDGRLDARGRRVALRDWLSRDLLAGHGAPSFPAVTAGDRLDRWADYVQRRGFDMQGTFETSTVTGPAPAPGEDDEPVIAALAEAVVALARLHAENEALAAENLRLDRKRRKHKKRVKDLTQRVA